eukprot:1133781-Rhodomonas_salina.4
MCFTILRAMSASDSRTCLRPMVVVIMVVVFCLAGPPRVWIDPPASPHLLLLLLLIISLSRSELTLSRAGKCDADLRGRMPALVHRAPLGGLAQPPTQRHRHRP